MIVSLDPPEKSEENEWTHLTTREIHFKDIAKELDKQAAKYKIDNDYRAAKVARDLADTLRKAYYTPTTVN